MYSLFLFTSALAFLALLKAVTRQQPAELGALGAGHARRARVPPVRRVRARRSRSSTSRSPDSAARRRSVPGIFALAAVAVAALPLWRSNLVLASRFDVGGRERRGAARRPVAGARVPPRGARRLRRRLDCRCSRPWRRSPSSGSSSCSRRRPLTFALCLLVFAVPSLGLALARVGGSAGTPETRHLIFALPFFAVARGVPACCGSPDRAGQRAPAVLALSVAALARDRDRLGLGSGRPTLYAGEPPSGVRRARRPSRWLAATSRPDDVLLRVRPALPRRARARRRRGPGGRAPSRPEARARGAARARTSRSGAASGSSTRATAAGSSRRPSTRLEIDDRSPGLGFETRVFGPFLIVRTRRPDDDAGEFLWDTRTVSRMGYWELDVPTAAINYDTAQSALDSWRRRDEATALGARP